MVLIKMSRSSLRRLQNSYDADYKIIEERTGEIEVLRNELGASMDAIVNLDIVNRMHNMYVEALDAQKWSNTYLQMPFPNILGVEHPSEYAQEENVKGFNDNMEEYFVKREIASKVFVALEKALHRYKNVMNQIDDTIETNYIAKKKWMKIDDAALNAERHKWKVDFDRLRGFKAYDLEEISRVSAQVRQRGW